MERTIEEKTSDSLVSQSIRRELKPGFDEKMMNETRGSFSKLMGSKKVTEWEKADYSGFDFGENEDRTSSAGFPLGSGRVKFTIGGKEYFILIDKMAFTLDGWQCNEISSRVELVLKN